MACAFACLYGSALLFSSSRTLAEPPAILVYIKESTGECGEHQTGNPWSRTTASERSVLDPAFVEFRLPTSKPACRALLGRLHGMKGKQDMAVRVLWGPSASVATQLSVTLRLTTWGGGETLLTGAPQPATFNFFFNYLALHPRPVACTSDVLVLNIFAAAPLACFATHVPTIG